MIDDEASVCNWTNERNKGSSYSTSHFHMSDSFDDLTSSLVFFVVFCRRSLNEQLLLKNRQYIFDSIQWNQKNWELNMNFLVLANSEHCWSYHGLALSSPHGPDSDILDFIKNLNFFGDNLKFTSLYKSLKNFDWNMYMPFISLKKIIKSLD